MLLEGILSIAGQPGLFKLISKGKHNVIVESLNTGKRMPAFSTSRISTLEDVAIYTEEGDVPLTQVFIKIFDKHGFDLQINNKSNAKELISFIEGILPDYDKERVYQSDIKKLVNWYNNLVDHKVITEEAIQKEKEAGDEGKTENVKESVQEEDKNITETDSE